VTKCRVYAFTGDAERQREEHVDQEALEVVENILILLQQPHCVYVHSDITYLVVYTFFSATGNSVFPFLFLQLAVRAMKLQKV